MSSEFCPKCGAVVQPGKKFCAACGAPQKGSGAARTVPEPGGQPAPQPTYAQQPAASQYAQQPPPNPVHAQSGYAPAPKKGGCAKIALIVIGSLVGLVALIFVVVFVVINNTANADYYKLGKDQIPSIKLVVEKRSVGKVEGATSGGVTTKTISYTDVESPTDDLTEYVTYLLDNEDFGVTEEYNPDVIPGSTQLAKESVDDGKIIILDIEYDQGGYTLVFTKGKGTYTANDS